ncbi:MAG: NUDIX domain-containing protein [Bacteroidota bacterium]
MYKVFVNNQSIHFVKSFNTHLFDNEDVEMYQYQSKRALLAEIDEFTAQKITRNLYIYCPENLTEVFSYFKSQYVEIKAGGGLVYNSKDEYLFILRLEKWDLPKGKLDKGETIQACAKREIEEETGIDSLDIVKKLPDTYHIYTEKNKKIIKHCYWFLMKTMSSKELQPQSKENITKAVWLKQEEIPEKMENTYPSISGLIFSYFKT